MKGRKQIFQANGEEKKKAVVPILISDKIDFKTAAITRDKWSHDLILKGVIQRKQYKPCKHICPQHRNTQIYKQNLGEPQERYRQQHNYSRGF